MVFIFAEAEFHWQSKWFFRPRQRIGTSVEDYYARFCDWKEEMISLSFPAEEGDYIEGFIENLSWDIRLRSSNYRSSRSGLINAFYNAKFEESMMFIDENLKKIKANMVAEGIRSELTVEEQLMQQPIKEQQFEAPLSTTSFEVTVKGQVNEDPNSAITSANLGVEVTGITQSSDEEIESATSTYNTFAEELEVSNLLDSAEETIKKVIGVHDDSENEAFKTFGKSIEPILTGLKSFPGKFYSNSMIEEVEFSSLKAEIQLDGKVQQPFPFKPEVAEVVYKVFDEMPNPFLTGFQSSSLLQITAGDSSSHSSFGDKKEDEFLPGMADNMLVVGVGKPPSPRMGILKASHRLIGEMREQTSIDPTDGIDGHEELIPPDDSLTRALGFKDDAMFLFDPGGRSCSLRVWSWWYLYSFDWGGQFKHKALTPFEGHKVHVNGVEQMLCQQCSGFHSLSKFDNGKRICRKRVAAHNERRRKNHASLLSSRRLIPLHSSTNFLESFFAATVSLVCPNVLHSLHKHDIINWNTNASDYTAASHGINMYSSINSSLIPDGVCVVLISLGGHTGKLVQEIFDGEVCERISGFLQKATVVRTFMKKKMRIEQSNVPLHSPFTFVYTLLIEEGWVLLSMSESRPYMQITKVKYSVEVQTGSTVVTKTLYVEGITCFAETFMNSTNHRVVLEQLAWSFGYKHVSWSCVLMSIFRDVYCEDRVMAVEAFAQVRRENLLDSENVNHLVGLILFGHDTRRQYCCIMKDCGLNMMNIGLDMLRPMKFQLGLLLNDYKHFKQYMNSNDYDGVAIAKLENFVWDPGRSVISFYILEDKDVFERVRKDIVLMDTTLEVTGMIMILGCLYGQSFWNLDWDALYASRCIPNGLGDTVGALDDIGLITKTLVFFTAELEHYIWDPGSFVSVSQLSWEDLGGDFHLTTLRTRWLLRRRICHDIAFYYNFYMYFRIYVFGGL